MRLPKYKTTIVSNILYVLLASTLSLLVFYDVTEKYGLSPLISLIAFAVLSLLGLLVYKLLSFTSQVDLLKNFTDKGRYITVVIFIFLMIASVIFRCLTYMWSGLGGNAYFEIAKVTGEAVPHYVHPADEMYVQLLHSVFFLFGNRIYVAAIVNCILQIIGVCLGFIAFRKLLGNIAALSFAGFWAITGFSVHEALTLNSRNLVFMFIMIGVFAISRAVPAREGKFISFVIAGLISAFCIYLDITGLVLIPFFVGEIFYDKDNEGSLFSLRFVKALISLLSTVLGFVLIIIIDGFASSSNPLNVITAILSRYFPVSDFTLGFSYMTSYTEVLVIAVLASLGVFISFLNDDDTRGVLLYSTIIILLINNFGLTYLENDGRCLFFTFAALLAGISLRELFPAEFKGDVFKAGSNVDNDVSYPDEGYVPAGLTEGELFSSTTPGGNVPYDVSAFDAVDIKAPTNNAGDGLSALESGDDKASLDNLFDENPVEEVSSDAEESVEETPAEEKPVRPEYVYSKPQLKPEWRRRPGGWVPINTDNSDGLSLDNQAVHEYQDTQKQSSPRVDENGVVLLDNPIPHPERKTQHKPMEFENTVSDSDMDFDVNVSDDDDFDV